MAYRAKFSVSFFSRKSIGSMSSREIAQFLGLSPNAINMRLSRARAQLKEEISDMMTTTFDTVRLQPSFTFRVIEAIKRTKIQTAPPKTALPFGVSVAAGLIALLLSLTIPKSPLYPIGRLIGSALPIQTHVPVVGEIPVNTIEVTEVTILSSEKEGPDFGQEPEPDFPMNTIASGDKDAQNNWEKFVGNPVLDLGVSGQWDDTSVVAATVLLDNGVYKMWYAGNDGTNSRIGYATSSDGINWTKYASNPVLDLGVSGEWADFNVNTPTRNSPRIKNG